MEVTDEYFFEHLFDGDKEDVVPPPQDIALPLRPTTKIATTIADDQLTTAASDSSDVEVMSHVRTDSIGRFRQCTITDAWRFYEARGIRSTQVLCRLQCDACRDQGTLMIPIGDEQYVHRTSKQWYPTDLIAGFCALVEHDAHTNVTPHPPYKDISHRVVMVHCPYPKGAIKEVLPIRDNATHFVSIVFNGSHFAVLYYDIGARNVSVFDGLNMSLRNWEMHIIHTVKEYGLKPLLANAQAELRTESHLNIKKMVLEIDFDDGEAPWIVQNERQFKQNDGYNCGPIAMLKVLEIYGWIRVGAIDLIAETPAGYRGFVMNFYMDLQKKYYDSLLAELRLSLVDDEIVIHEPVATDNSPGATMTGDMVESVVKPTTTKDVVGADAFAEATAVDESAHVTATADVEEADDVLEEDAVVAEIVDESADVTATADVEEADDVLEEDAVVAEIVVAEELEVEPTATNVEAVAKPTATNVEAVAKPTATNVEAVVEPITADGGATIDDVRATSMEMKKKRQEASAMKAIKQFGKEAISAGAAVGAVVSLKVDYRTHSHANGLIAIVYAVKEGTGGILVCCEHGVITHSGTKGDYWVPYDKYKVMAAKDAQVPLTPAIEEVRKQVLAGAYNPAAQKRISYAKLHDLTIQSSSPIKRGKGCSCKKGCKKGCGCKKFGYKCHSGCLCNGNCDGN